MATDEEDGADDPDAPVVTVTVTGAWVTVAEMVTTFVVGVQAPAPAPLPLPLPEDGDGDEAYPEEVGTAAPDELDAREEPKEPAAA